MRMIYFATVHWKMKFWIDIQLKYIQKYTQEPYRIYCFSTGIDINEYKDKFFYIKNTEIAAHWQKLDLLSRIILDDGNDNDLLIFIDGDAFPISDYIPFIRKKIENHKLVAIRRDENKDIIPHPSFCATTIGFWKKIDGTWSKGEWKNLDECIIYDTGGILYKKLEKLKVNWYPLLRTNKKNLHPMFFGIYERMIYHHGAAFRNPIDRTDMIKLHKIFEFFKKLIILDKYPKITVKILNRIRKHLVHITFWKNQALTDKMVRSIKNNDDFYNILNK